MKHRFIKKFILIFIFIFYGFNAISQSVNEYIKAEYIVSFGRFISGFNYNHGDTFLIAYYGKNMAQYNVLIDYVQNRKVKGRKIIVLLTPRIKQIEKIKPQILFVAKDKCRDLKRIYKHITGKHILMVSDYCDKNESFTMLNFLPLLYVRLQINKALLEMEGFKVPIYLSALAAKYKKDWKDLFFFSQDSLKLEKKKVKEQQEILAKLTKDIEIQKKELEKKKKEIHKKIKEIDSLQTQIGTKETILKGKEKKLKSILSTLSDKEKLLVEKDKEAKLKQKILQNKIDAIQKLENELNNKRKILQTQEEKIKLQNKEISGFAEKIQKQKLINLFATIVSIILVLFLIFVTYHYINKRKANKLLSEQNTQILQQKEEIQAQADQLEEKNKLLLDLNEEIKQQANELYEANIKLSELNEKTKKQKEKIEYTHKELKSSIQYAERIQKSILPKEDILRKIINDFFIFYKPKDIVSGDFYWWVQNEFRTYLAVADCTGHGVPGAFMSMLGISLLHNIVKDEPNLTTGQVLTRLRNEVVEALSQTSYNKQKDGMDLALISINKVNNTIEFSGANNPAYLVCEKDIKCLENCNKIKIYKPDFESNYKLYELRPDKMPIGIYEKMDNFKTIVLKQNYRMSFYMFSDGFADQFGGEKGKKYKYKPLKNLFLKIVEFDHLKQKEIIDKEFENWKKDYEQVDDVTILGIQL